MYDTVFRAYVNGELFKHQISNVVYKSEFKGYLESLVKLLASEAKPTPFQQKYGPKYKKPMYYDPERPASKSR
jgi:hypothetical protein